MNHPFASFMRLFDSYDFFRLVSLITGLGLFFFKLISERHNTSVLIVLLILCIVFIFEFYMIRLRAVVDYSCMLDFISEDYIL